MRDNREHAEVAYHAAHQTYERTADGSAEEAQAVLAMALAANAEALYEHADTLRDTSPA